MRRHCASCTTVCSSFSSSSARGCASCCSSSARGCHSCCAWTGTKCCAGFWAAGGKFADRTADAVCGTLAWIFLVALLIVFVTLYATNSWNQETLQIAWTRTQLRVGQMIASQASG